MTIDRRILTVVMLLFGIGLVQVYSASFIFALESYNDSLHFFRRQAIFTIVSLFVLIFFSAIRWSVYRKYGHWLWFFAAFMVGLTFVPGLGVKVGGAQRWIQLPLGFRFEPVELLKVAAPLLFMRFLLWNQETRTRILGLASLAIPLAMLQFQPDFGSLVILTAIFVLLFFTFGLHLKYLAGACLAAIPLFYFLVMNVPYRRNRVLAFLDPWSDPEQKGFQVIQSLLGFHNGGLTGVGLGQSQAKLFFLPEAHTDFTLAIWGEETGFVGFLILLALYAYIVFRGFQMSWAATDDGDRAAGLGLTLLLTLSIFINMGVVLGVLPAKGLTLPFMSYGGSSLVTLSFAVAMMLSLEKSIRLGAAVQGKVKRFSFRPRR